MKQILLATNNVAKIERYRKLFKRIRIECELSTPAELGVESLLPEENGRTLDENAEIKARAYFRKVNMPILANDTRFWVEGEGLIDAPKRKALNGVDEKEISKEELAAAILEFWKGVARKHGGKVDAAWIDAFALLNPDGTIVVMDSKREGILTDQEFGRAHTQFPMRALFISKATDKPVLEQTAEEEFLELQPISEVFKKLFIH